MDYNIWDNIKDGKIEFTISWTPIDANFMRYVKDIANDVRVVTFEGDAVTLDSTNSKYVNTVKYSQKKYNPDLKRLMK